jgi:phosphoglycolate phosphatase-like HAD superfamily hydrolase
LVPRGGGTGPRRLPFIRLGDRETEILLARNAGIKSVFVKTGYGLGEWEYNRACWKHQPDHVAEDLLAAVEWILKNKRAGK